MYLDIHHLTLHLKSSIIFISCYGVRHTWFLHKHQQNVWSIQADISKQAFSYLRTMCIRVRTRACRRQDGGKICVRNYGQKKKNIDHFFRRVLLTKQTSWLLCVMGYGSVYELICDWLMASMLNVSRVIYHSSDISSYIVFTYHIYTYVFINYIY